MVKLVIDDEKGLLFILFLFYPLLLKPAFLHELFPRRKLAPVSQNSICGLDLSTAIAAGTVTQES